VISLDLGDDISTDGVTSGADPTLWDTIPIDEDDRRKKDDTARQ
jgi:hypothetical protein